MDRNTLLLTLVGTTLHELRGVPVEKLPAPPVRLDRLAMSLIDAGLAEEAYSLAGSLVDLSRSEDRVYLADLGEWLLLSPVTMRNLMVDLESSKALAA